jgi:hypothetical protein
MMLGNKAALSVALGLSMTAMLAGCDNGPSAVAGKQAAGAQMASAEPPANLAGPAVPKADHRRDPVKLLDGKPEWASSRRYSADESAQRAFARNGEAFGARNLEDYERKAHAFVEHPPAGAETITRPNGDTLYYDVKRNVFAVANKDGAPRTMFKPDDGMAYWEKQKDRDAQNQSARSSRKSKNADDQA